MTLDELMATLEAHREKHGGAVEVFVAADAINTMPCMVIHNMDTHAIGFTTASGFDFYATKQRKNRTRNELRRSKNAKPKETSRW